MNNRSDTIRYAGETHIRGFCFDGVNTTVKATSAELFDDLSLGITPIDGWENVGCISISLDGRDHVGVVAIGDQSPNEGHVTPSIWCS